MNKKNIYIIIVSLFLLNVKADISYSQEAKNNPDDKNVYSDTNVEDIDLDLFMKDIYSKEQFYNPIDKRDPFRPFIKVVDTGLVQDDDIIDPLAPPIRRYKLDQFKLVGVFWLENTPQAMLVDPEKNTYMLTVGDHVGNRDGKIVEIRENGISVEEKIRYKNAEGLRSIKLSKSILAFKE